MILIEQKWNEYLDRYMLRDLTQSVTFTRLQDVTLEEKAQFEEKQAERRRNLMV